MRILVIGSGLIGVSTAYVLRNRGHEVTVVDRGEGPGRETSFANGALLTPSMSEPWNSPGSWRALLGSLFRSDAAMQLHLHALPSLAGWGVQFLRKSAPAAFEHSVRSNLHLALYSLEVLQALEQEAALEYGRAACGTLRIFRTEVSLAQAAEVAARRAAQGVRFRQLSQAETIRLEPVLTPIAEQLSGAIHYETDQAGDAYQYCTSLAGRAGERGVKFCFRTEVSLDVRGGRVLGAASAQERFVADEYIVAAGSYSTPLLARLGMHLPVRPVKGYSITFDSPAKAVSLRTPVVDDHLHAAVVPLRGAIRVAGTAEFAGFDHELRAHRVENLVHLLRQVLPQERFDPSAGKAWCGLRPMSADGVPLIGRTPITNLLLNTGHGHLGWTMAAGSARLLADLICGDPARLDPAPYAPARFRSLR